VAGEKEGSLGNGRPLLGRGTHPLALPGMKRNGGLVHQRKYLQSKEEDASAAWQS